MSDGKTLRLGLIGCGAFGEFCLEAFSELEGVRAVAVADIVAAAADRLAERFGAPACYEPAELIARDDVDIVHIATPPSTHCRLAAAAADAGKHVLCEKPLATTMTDADAIMAAVGKAGTIAPVNFVLRHNAVTDAVKAVIDSGALGRVLAGRLTNCAADSMLPPEHWFWKRDVSGGIFVEHDVHFFDLYAHWLGPGEVIAAHTETREGTDQQDRVMCTVRHAGGAVVSHYHAFDQVGPMDRTDHRLVCELGDIRVDGWIPLSMTVDAAVSDEGVAKLQAVLPDCRVESDRPISAAGMISRGQQRTVTRRVRLTHEPAPDKQAVYADSVRALLADQIAFIRDPSHVRRVVEQDGYDSLAMAARAVELAEG